MSMSIEYWSDFSCPFCYIGITHMEKALVQLGIADETNITMRAFELDRDAPYACNSNTVERYAGKYAMPYERAVQQVAEIEEIASEAGLDMHYTTARMTSTFDAHRLVKFVQAEQAQKARLLEHALYKAYFTDNLELADHEVLLSLAHDVGIEMMAAEKILCTEAYADIVRAEEREALVRGIRAVPHFDVDGSVLPGCASIERMMSFLEEACGKPDSLQNGLLVCGPDGCNSQG